MSGMYEDLAEIYERAGFTRFSRQMAPRVAELIRQRKPGTRRVCDLACGTGDAAVHLAREGFEMVGLDASARMLAQARAKGAAAGVQVQWLHADARDFVLPRPVDVVTCMYDALNYLLREEDLAAAFRCVRAGLQPGGLFIFDMNTRSGLAEAWGTDERVETPDDDLCVIWQSSYDHETEVNTVVLTAFVREGPGLFRRIREVHRERGHAVERVRALLGEAGLRVVALGDLDMHPLQPDSARFLAVAERPREG